MNINIKNFSLINFCRKISAINKSAGFTIIESSLIIGIFLIFAVPSIGVLREKKNYIMFQDAKTTVVRALEEARNRADIGFDATTKDHGVRLEGGILTVTTFVDGSAFSSPSDIEVILSSSISVDPANFTIIFTRLTGEATGAPIDPDPIVISGANGRTSTITVTPNGVITSE